MRSAFFALFTLAASTVSAQAPEVRADVLTGRIPAVHVGLGVTSRAGTYLRAGAVAGVGASQQGPSGRFDLFGRFHLDPFRESRWGLYAGGGLSARFEERLDEKIYVLVLAGMDGPVRRGVAMSVEAALGGGGRIGLVVRRAEARRR